jgi:hypothetical protein
VRRPAAVRAIAFSGACLVVASVALWWHAPAAHAEPPVLKGWWSSAPVGPDVPSDGLFVQGGLAGPIAYAALVYEFGTSTPGQLAVTVASGSASTPSATMQLCPLKTAKFDAKQGGSLEEAPAYEQSACLPPVAASSSGEYRFDAASLAHDGVLAVALLAASPSDRIVLDSPGSDSLHLTEAGSGGGGDVSGSAGPGATDVLPSSSPAIDSSATFDVPSVSLDAPTTVAAPTTTTVPTRRQALPVGATEPLPRITFLYTVISVAALAVGGAGFLMRRMGVSWTG